MCEGVDNSLWHFPPFNEVSGMMNHPTIDDHGSSRFNTKVPREDGLFMTKKSLIYACQKHSIKHRREYGTSKSSTTRLILECRRGKNKCKLKLRASKKKNKGMWRITKYEENHTCEVNIIPQDNVHFNKHFIGMDIRNLIQEKLVFSPYMVQALMRDKYDYNISYMKAWKSRQKALLHISGDWEESFKKLLAYMDMIKESNPGSIVYWDTSTLESGKVIVNQVFWSFALTINGFVHCRPILSIDATHLIGKWKGVLIIAVGLDVENQILPLAYALVESKNIESWKWFMTCIRSDVTQRDGLCIILDRHIGIMRVMEEVDWSPPRVYHRICIRHFPRITTKRRSV
ncbi:hypothetical protein QQ045_030378 [Rhodiola kirilowii]